MEQSCDELEAVEFLDAIVRSRLWAATLKKILLVDQLWHSLFVHLLETIWLVLPSAVQLQPHLDAAENHFFATLEIDSELYNIPVVNGESFALLRRRAKADVIEERARRALYVPNKPFPVLTPELTMATTNNLALEADGGGRRLVAHDVGHGLVVPF